MRVFFFFQAEDGIRDADVTGVQTCALPISDPVILTVKCVVACQRIAFERSIGDLAYANASEINPIFARSVVLTHSNVLLYLGISCRSKSQQVVSLSDRSIGSYTFAAK